MTSNWVGFACGYAKYGATQWRLPLGIQIPWGIIMFIGLSTFMPNSPRQLIRQGKTDQARKEFIRIRRDLASHEVHHEFAQMHAQIVYEMEREIKSFKEAFKLYRHRVMVSIAVQTMTSLTGVNVIQYFQTLNFKSLGVQGHMILALAAIYGTLAFSSNVMTTVFLTDQWGRRKMILAGLGGVVIIEIYAAVMQHVYQNTNNKLGKGFAVAGIYMFVVWYYGMLNSTTWLYGSEVLPIALRSKVMGLAAASHFIVNVAITEAGPTANAKLVSHAPETRKESIPKLILLRRSMHFLYSLLILNRVLTTIMSSLDARYSSSLLLTSTFRRRSSSLWRKSPKRLEIKLCSWMIVLWK